MMHVGQRSRVAVAEYIQGHRDGAGVIVGERMETWFVFFPASSRRHLSRFKPGDLVLVKGTVHQTASDEYRYAVNGECIKHFFCRDIGDEMRREKPVDGADTPDVNEYLSDDF